MAVNDSKYKTEFNEISVIGSGGFSTVFKSESISDNKIYAIKKVCFKPEDERTVAKELKFLTQLNSEFAVKYVNSWIEPNYYIDLPNTDKSPNLSSTNLLFSTDLTKLLHIQMELCSLTLRDAINVIKDKCMSATDNTISVNGYYIASELLYEILECVHYLHQQKPPIIHRDLKPENILLTNFDNNRFIKLSDFGLSTFHEFAEQSHTKYTGTKNYRAFELNFNSHYTTKADIYSLGIIVQELFRININESKRRFVPVLEPKITYLLNLIKKLLSYTTDERPNCDQILSEKHLWRLSDGEISSDQHFKQIVSKTPKSNSIEEDFIEFFIQNKYAFQQNVNTTNNSIQPSINSNNINDNYNTAKENHIVYRAEANTNNNNNRSILPSIPSLPSLSSLESLSLQTKTQSTPVSQALSGVNTMNTAVSINDDNIDYEYYTVSLNKSESGFGIRMVGGVEEGRNVVISSIVTGGVAHHNGVLKVGDEIVAINDRSVTGRRHHEVVHIIAQSGQHVSINVRRKRYSTVI